MMLCIAMGFLTALGICVTCLQSAVGQHLPWSVKRLLSGSHWPGLSYCCSSCSCQTLAGLYMDRSRSGRHPPARTACDTHVRRSTTICCTAHVGLQYAAQREASGCQEQLEKQNERTEPHADCILASPSSVTFSPRASASALPQLQLAQALRVGLHPANNRVVIAYSGSCWQHWECAVLRTRLCLLSHWQLPRCWLLQTPQAPSAAWSLASKTACSWPLRSTLAAWP